MENQSVGSPLTGRFAQPGVHCSRDGKTTENNCLGQRPAEASGWLVGEWVIGTVHGLKICATSHQIPVLKS